MSGRKFLSAPVVPVVTALPGSPVDGQLVHFLADATNGIVWQLRYRAYQADGVTANPSSYKWEYIGGGPLRVEQVGGRAYGTSEGTSALNFAALTTPGPSITVPLAGDYLCEGGAEVIANTLGNLSGILLYTATDGTVPWNNSDAQMLSQSNNFAMRLFARRVRTGLAAGVAVELRYATSSGGNVASYWDRSLYVTPVRVG